MKATTKAQGGGSAWKCLLLVAVIVLCSGAFMFGKKSQNKTSKNLVDRLEKTRNRYQICDKERKIVKGEIKAQEDDEIMLANEEHTALIEENGLLVEDNEGLKEENFALEDEIDQLREELDDRDWVSDDEMSDLQEVVHLGNASKELTDLLEEAGVYGGVNKGDLLQKLIDVTLSKRQTVKNCLAKLDALQQRKQLADTAVELQKLKKQAEELKATLEKEKAEKEAKEAEKKAAETKDEKKTEEKKEDAKEEKKEESKDEKKEEKKEEVKEEKKEEKTK